MFFALSKILWVLTNPGNLLLMALCLGWALLWTRWRRLGRLLVGVAAVAGATLAVVPVGTWLFAVLEDRFPALTELPSRVDGVIVVGGVVDPVLSRDRGQVAVGGAAERLIEMAALARGHPEARLVFTGGSGSLLHQEVKEAHAVVPLLSALGIDPGRVVFEDESRNTWENAEFSRRKAQPQPGETWLLVTSAFHMPRAVGCFREAGWTVVAHPVDYLTRGDAEPPFQFNFAYGVGSLGGAVHEFLGLLFYRLSGKTDALFPAPRP
ncbi:MAG: YdcF family protein [Rhodospirillales bacterium]